MAALCRGGRGDPTLRGGRCLAELRGYLSHGQPTPQYQIHLCFGEEYPTSAGHHFQKLIMAHVSTHRGTRSTPELGTGAVVGWGGHTDLHPPSLGSVLPQVEPVFARELLHHAQRVGPTLLRESPQPCAPGASSHVLRVLKQLCQP